MVIDKLDGYNNVVIKLHPKIDTARVRNLKKKIEEYLELDIEEDDIWDDYGFKAEYLFY